MKSNHNDFGGSLRLATSAMRASTIAEEMKKNQKIIEQANQKAIKNNEILLAGAEANIAQKELLEQQIEIFQKQNELLLDNYSKLEEMFDSQVEANKEAKEELRRSRRFNVAMMIIAIIAMLAAIAGPIATIWVSK